MFGLPKSTQVNLRIYKEKLVSNAKLNTAYRQILTSQVEAIYWRNKLAPSTLTVTSGQIVDEIQIFELQLRQPRLDTRLIHSIVKAVPYHLLLCLTHDDKAQLWIYIDNTPYHSSWLSTDTASLNLAGNDLDSIFASLARQIAAGRLDSSPDLSQAVTNDKQRQKLLRQITSLERKLQNEPQFNKQMKQNNQLRRLKTELERLAGETKEQKDQARSDG